MVSPMGQVSTAQPEHKLAFLSKTHLVSSEVVLHCQTGPLEALAWISLQEPVAHLLLQGLDAGR